MAYPPGAADAAAVSAAAAAAVGGMLARSMFQDRAWRSQRPARLYAFCIIAVVGGVMLWETAGALQIAHDAAWPKGGRGGNAGGAAEKRGVTISRLSMPGVRDRLLADMARGVLSCRSRGLIAALVLADRSGLNERLRETYSSIGIAHVLALSGLHLGVIAAALARGLPFIIKSPRWRDAALFAILSLYASVACFPPSLVRALALGGAVMARRHSGLNGDLAGALVAGSFAIAAADQTILFDVGFQLSFCAVMGIAFFGVPLMRRLEARLPSGARGVALRALAYPAIVSGAVQIFSLPLTVSLFGRSPLLAPLVNMIFSLPFTVLLYLGVLYVFLPIGAMRFVLAPIINVLCEFLIAAPEAVAGMPQPGIIAGDGNWRLYGCAVVAAALSLRASFRRRAALGALAAAIAGLSFCVPGRPCSEAHGGARDGEPVSCGMSLLRGDGFVYVRARESVLFLGRRFGAGEARFVTRELWKHGVRSIERCVILPATMAPRHGLRDLAAKIAVGEIFCSPYLMAGERGRLSAIAATGACITIVSSHRRIEAGGILVDISAPPFPPPPGRPLAGSEAGLSCLIVGPLPVGAPGPFSVDPDESGAAAGANHVPASSHRLTWKPERAYYDR